MEFRLTYEGKLASTRSNKGHLDTRWEHKHAIRRHFHSQLKKYWDLNPVLKEMMIKPAVDFQGRQSDARHEGMLIKARNFNWLPLVVEGSGLECRLEILYLRNGARGGLISDADIDNRMKTLIDALKAPRPKEIHDDERPSDDEEPFFVLLEDDRLITHLSVESGLLLSPTDKVHKSEAESTDARVILKVTVTQTIKDWQLQVSNANR